jgi:1-acyl-sn-glycerol-3-phosphate acyltransferase
VSVPESLGTRVQTAVGVMLLSAAVATYSAVVALLVLLGVSNPKLHRVYLSFARVCLRVAGTRLEVHGSDRIQPGQACVIVSNHTSSWDIPCIIAGLPELIVRFVVKDELMRIPVFGQAMRLSGNVKVVRSRTTDDVQRIQEQMDRRDPAVSLLFFAEGTRTPDGALRPFKMGAFATALGYELPILPIALAGPFVMWPKGKLRVHRVAVAIEVGEPIPVEGLEFADRNTLRAQTHEAVTELRARARQRLRDQGFDPGGVD